MNRPFAVVAVAVSLVAAACGARLTDQQLADATGGQSADSGVQVPGALVPAATTTTLALAGSPAGPAAGGNLPDRAGGQVDGQDAGGDAEQPVADGGGLGQPPQPAENTRQPGGPPPPAPAEGNGGPTDIGVTADSITIAVVADRSGPIPGLFENSVSAVNAWANLVNAQGGIYGRKIKVKALDSKTDASANRAATIDACSSAFAMVGSMSAFDAGGAAEVDRCGIPDISSTIVTSERSTNKNSYGAHPLQPRWWSAGAPVNHIGQQNPGVTDHAGVAFVDAAVGSQQAEKERKGRVEALGWTIVYERGFSPVESNFGPYVLEMKEAGVRYFHMIGDATNQARMLQAMKQQNFRPEIIDFNTSIYSQSFLQQTGNTSEGVLMPGNFVPFEEVSTSPEMQLYFQLLQSVGGTEDLFGLYSWSAGRLFTEIAVNVGPNLTRERFFEELAKFAEWDGFGIHVPHEFAAKKPSPCFVLLEIRGGQFVRNHPAGGGFDCSGQTYDLG